MEWAADELRGLYHPGNVFSYHVEFEVVVGAGDDGLDIGVVEGIGDNGDIEFRFFDIKNSEAGAVEADGAFFDDEVAEFFGEFEAIFPAAVEVAAFETNGGGVDVPLDDVPVEATVHHEASFEVDEASGLPVAEIGLFKGLFYGCDAVEVVLYFFDSKANAVMGYALVNGQLLRNG